MRLAVVGDTRHFLDHEDRLCTLDGVASQLEQWAALFDELVLVAPLHSGPPPPGFRPYRCPNVSLQPLPPAGGSTAAAKARLVGRIPAWSRRIARALADVDAVHFRCPSNVALVGLLVDRLALPRRHRYAMYAGNWHGYQGEPWSYRLQRRLLAHRRFGGLVTVYSDSVPTSAHVVPLFSPSFTLEDWDREASQVKERDQGWDDGRPLRLVTVGDLTENKRQSDVIRAVRMLLDRGVDTRLDVVGDGPLARDLAGLLRTLGLGERVRLCGRLDHGEVRGHYRRADLNVLASRTEGYPKVVVEGMVAGAVPVISDFPLARSLVAGGERGLTFRGGDPASLATRIAELRASPPRVARMIEAGRDYSRTVTLDAYRDRIETLLDQHWNLAPPIRVLHVLDTLRVGGQERMAVEIANLLDPADFEVTVCATREGGPMKAEVRAGVDTTVLGRRSTWDLVGLARFCRLVRSRRIEVVHSHGSGPARMVALCRALHLVGARHVFHDHAAASERARRPPGSTKAWGRLGVDAYLGVEAGSRGWAVSTLGMAPDRVAIVPNGVDLARFAHLPPGIRPDLDLEPDDLALVMVAGFRPEKGHPAVLQALARRPDLERLRLLLVGPHFEDHAGYYDRCRSMIDDLGLAGRVRLLGPRADVAAVLASVDGGVLSSPDESGPLALAEYMAAGLPYIVTDTGELTRAVKGSGTGWVVPPRDPEAMAAAFGELVAMAPADRQAMGKRGRRLAHDLFDQRRVVASVADVYRRLARG
jgi:glycosyltransferase involved in cell wall biosynthesis